MYGYRNPPPLPTPEETYQRGKRIGGFSIDILPDGDNLKIYTYWYNFRNTDFKQFSNHPVLEILKQIYNSLKPDEFAKKPPFKEFFDDMTDDILSKTKSRKPYPKGTKFVAYLQLEIILKPYDFEKGNLFFRYNNYGFPQNISQSLQKRKLYPLLTELDVSLKNKKNILLDW